MHIKPIEVFARKQNASGSLLLNRIKQIDGEVDEIASICIQSTIDAKELTNIGGRRGEDKRGLVHSTKLDKPIVISLIQISSSVHFRHT